MARSRSVPPVRGFVLTLAAAALALGLLIYLVARPPGHAALIPTGWTLATAGLGAGIQATLGTAAGWLPSLLHPFGFTLLLAAALAPTRTAALGAGLLWWSIDVAAEWAQWPALAVPLASWLDQAGAPPLLAAYLRQGRFDPADLAATTAGALAAVLLLLWALPPREVRHDI